MPDALFDLAADIKPRWTGTLAVVRIDETCPNGHGPLTVKQATQGVLFRHAGYGAPVRTTWRICLHCFWSIESEVVEVNPKLWAA